MIKEKLYIILLASAFLVHAQEEDSTSSKKKGVVVLPAIFFSPETSLGFGAASLFYFRPKNQQTGDYRPSNLQNVFIYTLENQILFTSLYNVFLEREKFWLKGELSFYVYPYEFYGIGIDVSTSPENAELYTANFLRLETNNLVRVNEGFYLGPSLFLDQYYQIETDENGRLETNNVTGIDPQRLFGLGASFILDRRNNIFCPYAGYYLEGRVLQYENKLIGNYTFTDMYIDARKYFYPNNEWETGLQLYHQSVLGDPPFYNYALLGGGKRMRGYYKGAYRDHHQTVLQAEVRRYLFERIVIAGFGGIGSVSDTFGGYDKVLGSYGLGLRYEINTKEHIRIRFDYARGYKTDGFYININEAF